MDGAWSPMNPSKVKSSIKSAAGIPLTQDRIDVPMTSILMWFQVDKLKAERA